MDGSSGSINRFIEKEIKAALRKLPLGGLRFYKQAGSTNEIALAWAADGAPDGSLVVADEQTSGRGRSGAKWLTPPGSSLAFSVILRPLPGEINHILLFTALGALAVSDAIHPTLGLSAEIKWPNDILLDRRKVCGILAETSWMDDKVESIVLGIGVNVTKSSLSGQELFRFPATCLEDEAGKTVDRLLLLREILEAILKWRPRLGTESFLRLWESRLAFRGRAGQRVR